VSRVAYGLDLGADQTIIACARGPKIEDVSCHSLRSVVAYTADSVLTGDDAAQQHEVQPLLGATRIIGESWSSGVVKKMADQSPGMLGNDGMGTALYETIAGQVSPTDVAAKLIGALLPELDDAYAEASWHLAVPSAAIGRVRQSMLEAANAAGLTALKPVEMPIAVTRAHWGLIDEEEESRILVYDFGAGSFEVAICGIQSGLCVVKSHARDPFLGGDHFDQLLLQWVLDKVRTEFSLEITPGSDAMKQLASHCKQAKLVLTSEFETSIALSDIVSDANVKAMSIDRFVLDHLVDSHVQRTLSICDQVLASAGLRPTDVQSVLLAGGGAMMPFVETAIGQHFPDANAFLSKPRLGAIGAALLAWDPPRLESGPEE